MKNIQGIIGIAAIVFAVAIVSISFSAPAFAARGGHGDHHDGGHENEMVTICHKSGHGRHTSWQELTVRERGWDGHVSHGDDFLVTSEHPCPPSFDGDSDEVVDDGNEVDQDDSQDCGENDEENGAGDDDDDTDDDTGGNENDGDDDTQDNGATTTDETSATSTNGTSTDVTTDSGVDEGRARGGGACMNCGTDEDVAPTSTPEVATSTDQGAGNDDEGDGEVLGATCVPLLTSYLREGRVNPEDEVRKLQGFLAQHLGIDLAVTGIFDSKTTEFVNAFQLRYLGDVLAPWVPFGLENEHTPTGYVYKTTLWKINEIVCPERVAPKPALP